MPHNISKSLPVCLTSFYIAILLYNSTEHASHSRMSLAQFYLENVQISRASHLSNSTWRTWKSLTQVTCTTLPGELVSHSRKYLENMQITRASHLHNATWIACKSLVQLYRENIQITRSSTYYLPSSAWRTCKSLAQVTYTTLPGEHLTVKKNDFARQKK